MTTNTTDIDRFYRRLFTEDPAWSTPFPNSNEASRWAKICDFLSQIPNPRKHEPRQRLRILDVGCGRGWLTHLASVYGCCEGVDPVASSVALARKYFPNLTFYMGTAIDIVRSPEFKPYDVVIASEVIEHVVDKRAFLAELTQCLVPDGYLIVTTPRREEFRKWLRLGYEKQPIEAWISERELRELFEEHSLRPIRHDRVYLDIPDMSLLHRLCASPKFSTLLDRLSLTCVQRGMQYVAGFFHVWWCQWATPSP